jgi:predicted O-methyltransferase YrrM
MNPVLVNLLSTENVTAPDGRQLPLHSHLPELEGRLLQWWLDQYRPSRLLEIGLAYGVSSLFICEVVSRWQVHHYHVIDAFQSRAWEDIGRKNLAEAGFGELFACG